MPASPDRMTVSGRRRRRSLGRSLDRPSLDLDPLTERRKHLREDDLLVPHRIVRVLLHAGAALQTTMDGMCAVLEFRMLVVSKQP